ncbi:hypothetical protein [Corynebacterium mastitidis]|nr:hypothetical protein [Corynebacterium mastitidis]
MLDREDALFATLGIILIAVTTGWKIALPVAAFLTVSAYLRHRHIKAC